MLGERERRASPREPLARAECHRNTQGAVYGPWARAGGAEMRLIGRGSCRRPLEAVPGAGSWLLRGATGLPEGKPAVIATCARGHPNSENLDGRARIIENIPVGETEARFGAFFRDLAVAGRALSSYPRGHPAAVDGLARACAALSALLAETGPVELAATRDALLWSDLRFTSSTAAQLARLLRRRRAAGLLLEPEVSTDELEVFLRALTLDARSAREAGSLCAELAAAGIVHLRVRDLDFSGIALVEGDEEISAPEAGRFSSRVVRRLLANGSLTPDQLATWVASGRTAADLLQALFDGSGVGGGVGAWGAAAAAGALRAAADDFCESPDAERAAAIAELHPRLRGGDRERLVQELAASVSRHASARDCLAQLSAALSPQVTAELRLAIGRAAAREQSEAGTASAAAPRISARQLANLRQAFAADDVDTLRDVETDSDGLAALLELPEDRASAALSPAAAEVGRALGDRSLEGDVADKLLALAERADVPPDALPQILPRVEAGYLRLLSSGRTADAAALVESVHWGSIGEGPVPAAIRGLAERISSRESVEVLVLALPGMTEEAFRRVPALVENLEPTAVRHLLGALAETDDRRLRFLLLELLAKLGSAVARDAASLLSDPRWYVVRNMLLILRRIGDSKSLPAVRKCVAHPDLRVRLEAIQNLFAFDRDAPRELLRQALNHSDLREAEAAMLLAGKYGIAEAVEPIVDYLGAWDPFGRRRAVRLEAIRALAAIGDPAALTGLGRFRARFHPLAPAIEERRELYRTLSSYPEESRRVWIESGLRSRDAEIRRLCAAMASRPGAAS